MSLNEKQQAEENLKMRQTDQERMKYVNKAYKFFIKDREINRDLLQVQFPNLSDDDVKLITTFVVKNSWITSPFASFEITNNGAEIRRLTKRVQELEAKEQAVVKAAGENEVRGFTGGRLIYNYEADRVQIEYDEKPPRDTIQLLRDRGFKWAPSLGVWQRQLTANGKMAADYIVSRTGTPTTVGMIYPQEEPEPLIPYPTDGL